MKPRSVGLRCRSRSSRATPRASSSWVTRSSGVKSGSPASARLPRHCQLWPRIERWTKLQAGHARAVSRLNLFAASQPMLTKDRKALRAPAPSSTPPPRARSNMSIGIATLAQRQAVADIAFGLQPARLHQREQRGQFFGNRAGADAEGQPASKGAFQRESEAARLLHADHRHRPAHAAPAASAKSTVASLPTTSTTQSSLALPWVSSLIRSMPLHRDGARSRPTASASARRSAMGSMA
jgi:hypothetical protein